ncbi:DNA-binding transcriptional regulator, GntR family [Paramicrobacterium humi]|uniref:DNA-binding transcriptional regulator, GntR family n=1 Tax=Paramicrobacterium humi TaxID=640635 RepID=A0A1H4JDY7_9MICO|nr:GntR family transcriptional regulator [Microbacterium humi]SEB44520.1 DNA-binding transcriptional regulator, GntR family [Microbacterium humi]
MARSTHHSGVPASVFRVPRTSTVDLIAIELRNAIFSGALPVGSAIGEVEISSQLGVSRSPLREATQRLVQEGLLTATPGRGLRVSIIAAEHVPDVYNARAAVEEQAIRLIVRRDDAAAIAALEGPYATLVALSEGTDARAIGDADIAFHQALVDAAGSTRLSHYMRTLAIETRIASFSVPDGYAVRRSVSPTYRLLLDALRARDATSAVAALESQFDDAVARLTGAAHDVETLEPGSDDVPATFEPIETPEP